MIQVGEAQLLGWLSAFLLPFFRILGLFSSAPILSQRAVPLRVRIALSLTLVVIAELFHQMAKAVFEAFPSAPVGLMRKTLRLGMAAVFASIGGSALVVGALFLRRIMELLGER